MAELKINRSLSPEPPRTAQNRRIVEPALAVSRANSSLRAMGYTRFRQQRAGSRRMPSVKNIGKPCAGKLHARLMREGRRKAVLYSTC